MSNSVLIGIIWGKVEVTLIVVSLQKTTLTIGLCLFVVVDIICNEELRLT